MYPILVSALPVSSTMGVISALTPSLDFIRNPTDRKEVSTPLLGTKIRKKNERARRMGVFSC